MHSLTRCVSALSAAAAALAVLTGCGSSSDTIAQVAGQTISKATLHHWTSIEAVLAHNPTPQQPPANGEIPDPPHYTACIAWLKAGFTPGTGTPAPTTAQLKTQCQQHYKAVRNHMLQILISYDWTTAEAAAHGVSLSDHELQKAFAQFKHREFPTEAIFQKFLKDSGESPSDELFLVRFDVLAKKLEYKIIGQIGIPRASKFYHEFPKRWAAQTNCSPEYIIPECKQYKGTQEPEAAI